jgi:hypothetical protein
VIPTTRPRSTCAQTASDQERPEAGASARIRAGRRPGFRLQLFALFGRFQPQKNLHLSLIPLNFVRPVTPKVAGSSPGAIASGAPREEPDDSQPCGQEPPGPAGFGCGSGSASADASHITSATTISTAMQATVNAPRSVQPPFNPRLSHRNRPTHPI